MNAPYTDTMRKWAVDTRRAGTLDHADGVGEVGLGEDDAGKRLAVRFALQMADGYAVTVRFQVFGCGFTVAACAAVADLAEGRTLTELDHITPDTVGTLLGGLPRERDYCAGLAVEALQAAVKSCRTGRNPVAASLTTRSDHRPRVTANNRTYRLLIDSPSPAGVSPEDRHLFACLLAVACSEPYAVEAALGLHREELLALLALYFPVLALTDLKTHSSPAMPSLPATNRDILNLLFDYLPAGANGSAPSPSVYLARIVAARIEQPGHLWRALGLCARPELTAAIRRHLPALAAANNKGLRWKRFLYKQLCEKDGGVMCKAPACGVCSDYVLCFADGD